MKKQSGSAHVIIVVALVVLLIGALGFIFWQNFIQKSDKTNDSATNTSKTSETPKKSSEAANDTTPIAKEGTIVGSLTYPSEGIPPSVEVHATNIATNEDFYTKDHLSGSLYKYGVGYKLSVPVGQYYVYAIKAAGAEERAYYDNFAECGFANYDTCKNPEEKITVTVESNKETKDILVGDWYYPCLISGGKQPTEKFNLPTC